MLRTLIALKPREVPLRVALRNTFAVVAPLAVGIAIDQVPAGLAMATGAINTMFTDLPGPYRLRMWRMFAASCAAGLAALAGLAIGDHTLLLLPLVMLLGFASGLLVALGPVPARVGLTSVIVLMITADMRLGPQHALGVGALIFAGGLLQMTLALAAWPLQRYRPERFALASLLQQLAGTARAPFEKLQGPPPWQGAQDTLQMLYGSYRARGPAMQAFRVIAQLCERVRLDLLALTEIRARIDDVPLRTALDALSMQAGDVLELLSRAMRDAVKPLQAGQDAASFDAAAQQLAARGNEGLGKRDRRLQAIAVIRVQSLAGQLRAMARNGDWASSSGEIRAAAAEAQLPKALRPGDPLQTLRANFALASVAMRHALRCSVCLGLAVALERGLAIPHGVWIPMTAAIVLKPDFGGTLRFGLLRVAGTFAGLLLTTVIVHYAIDDAVPRLLLMGVLCLGFRLTAQVNYGIGVSFLTGMLVMLLSFEGIAPGAAVEMRLLATLVGCAMALMAYTLWPTWEGRRTDVALSTMLDAYRTHVAAVLGADMAELDETRSAARAARSNVVASVERLRADPARRREGAELARAEAVLANANRLLRAALSLEALLLDGHRLPPGPALARFAARVDHALRAMATSLQGGNALVLAALRSEERTLSTALDADDVPEPMRFVLADAADRIADGIDTLAHLLRKPAPEPAAAPGQPTTAG